MNLQIREARTEDYTSICKLSREQLGYDFPPDETRIGAHAFYQQCGYAKQKAQFNFRKFL